jgi:carboxymethylenebutenolidase
VTPPARSAGSGYLVHPLGGAGPGVLVLHSWWGLTPFFKSVCDRLADDGFTALAPDLLAGHQPATPDEAETVLARADVDRGAALVLSSARALRAASDDPRAAIGVVGFSMGASWGLWLSARSPLEVAATVAFYGTQIIDFAEARSAYLGHFAEFDALVPDDEVVELEAHLKLLGLDTTFWRYPGTAHWFFEADRRLAYVQDAAELAWIRTTDFLRRHLAAARGADDADAE